MTSEKELRRNMEMSVKLCGAIRASNFKVDGTVVNVSRQHVIDQASHQRDVDTVRQFLRAIDSNGWPVKGGKFTKVQDASGLVQLMQAGKGGLVLQEVLSFPVPFYLTNEDPVRDRRIFALALLARYQVADRINATATEQYYPDPEVEEPNEQMHTYWYNLQQTALKSAWKVTPHSPALFLFVRYCEQVSKQTSKHTGWGRSMKKMVQSWYLRRTPDEVGTEIMTYAKGFVGFTHRDMLRLAHPNPAKSYIYAKKKAMNMTYTYDLLFHYACHGTIDIFNHYAQSLSAWNPPVYEITSEMVFQAKGSNVITQIVELEDKKQAAKEQAAKEGAQSTSIAHDGGAAGAEKMKKEG